MIILYYDRFVIFLIWSREIVDKIELLDLQIPQKIETLSATKFSDTIPMCIFLEVRYTIFWKCEYKKFSWLRG